MRIRDGGGRGQRVGGGLKTAMKKVGQGLKKARPMPPPRPVQPRPIDRFEAARPQAGTTGTTVDIGYKGNTIKTGSA